MGSIEYKILVSQQNNLKVQDFGTALCSSGWQVRFKPGFEILFSEQEL